MRRDRDNLKGQIEWLDYFVLRVHVHVYNIFINSSFTFDSSPALILSLLSSDNLGGPVLVPANKLFCGK